MRSSNTVGFSSRRYFCIPGVFDCSTDNIGLHLKNIFKSGELADIFGWKPVGYWQMLGLLALAHLFFGHLGHSGWHEHRHIHRAMHGMSHEERREFIRQRIRSYREENPTDECPEK